MAHLPEIENIYTFFKQSMVDILQKDFFRELIYLHKFNMFPFIIVWYTHSTRALDPLPSISSTPGVCSSVHSSVRCPGDLYSAVAGRGEAVTGQAGGHLCRPELWTALQSMGK